MGDLKNNMVWIDMEMTGLDVVNDHILEVACLITDDKLNIRGSPFSQIVHVSDDILNGMNDWCKTHHEQSGLTQKVKESSVTIEQTEELLLDFLKKHNIPVAQCPLAGNSVYMDRLFMKKYMPSVDKYLHYRIVDVSTVGILSRLWSPTIEDNKPIKKRNHRALDDITESINQLKYYKDNLFKTQI
ncbi:probable oligoribonuclease isoform X2 [Aphidius gifuensis]|nr:probable oligoribonuclease isoform X2 [Aphidius gifuensis]XP_044019854.1 probable oligoribonuclease isoform X2 [Aphidius gifuensis]